MDYPDKKVLILGAGAIGATIAAWTAPHHAELYVTDVGETLDALKTGGITVYKSDKPEST